MPPPVLKNAAIVDDLNFHVAITSTVHIYSLPTIESITVITHNKKCLLILTSWAPSKYKREGIGRERVYAVFYSLLPSFSLLFAPDRLMID